MEVTEIEYRFLFENRPDEAFTLKLHPETLELERTADAPVPAWANLEYKQCSHCPLRASENPVCPAAIHMVDLVNRFHEVVSHDKLTLEVCTAERTVLQKTSAQEAISSMVGLMLASSGCPHTRYFRPMAKFHLPLANQQETTYRSASMFLLGQFFRHLDGEEADLDMDGLKTIYANLRIVNLGLVDRLRSASESDSTLNAVVLLDAYTLLVPGAIEQSLDELRPIFVPFL